MKDNAILLHLDQFSAIFVISGPVSHNFSFFFWILVSGFLWLGRFPGHQPGQQPLVGLHWVSFGIFWRQLPFPAIRNQFQPLRTTPAVRNFSKPLLVGTCLQIGSPGTKRKVANMRAPSKSHPIKVKSKPVAWTWLICRPIDTVGCLGC